MKVLIAEDVDSVRLALRMVVEHLGHQVIALARDGIEALQQCEQARPELVVMDVRMPRLDGLACTEKLAQLNPQVRVVIVTAGRTTEVEARRAGARAYIEKPFDVDQVDRAIQMATAA